MSDRQNLDVSALAINLTIPESLRWTDTRRGEEFTLSTLNIRLLPDGHLATKAYGRPTAGGRGTYVSFTSVSQSAAGPESDRRRILDEPPFFGVLTGGSARTRADSVFCPTVPRPVIENSFSGTRGPTSQGSCGLR